MSYTIALAGNPNCGKTSVFNALTGSRQHVGNWPGVTVDKKEGEYKKDRTVTVLDLPGTYSLSPYSEEEKIARDYIVKERPAAVIDIVDGTSIERNLYLTLQILETGVPVVIALNMIDEVEKRGDKIDAKKLSELLGVPVIPTCGRNGKGTDELMKAAIDAAKKGTPSKLEKIYNEGDSEEVIADKRYKYIAGIVKQAVVKASKPGAVRQETTSDKIDKILTNRFLALPLFAVIMYLMFACALSENFLFLGINGPGRWLEGVVGTIWEYLTGLVEGGLEAAGAADWAMGLVIDGIFGGIGAILGFMPLVLVLYVLMAFLEDSGYMARVAFVMDRIFRKFGLSGRSFIPILMGFGCSVPAIMATRTLESEKDRRITAIITGMVPCGAKLPIFAMFCAIFFPENTTLVMFAIYMTSIAVAIIVSLLMNKLMFKSAVSNFIMELPQYRWPTIKSVLMLGWEKVKGFGVKAGTVILLSTILIWVLSNFNLGSLNGKNLEESAGEEATVMCAMDDSFMASIGNFVAPIFKPLGFGEWRPAVGIVTGWIAKENVVVTFAQLYSDDTSEEYLAEFFGKMSAEELEELGFENGEYDPEAAPDIYSEGILFEGADENALPTMKKDIRTPNAALAYMLFNLLCMPCFAAVGSMKRELKTWKKTWGGVGIQMLTAYVVALVVYWAGFLFV